MKNGHIKIQKGIPIPKSTAGAPASEFTIALLSMKIGESFYVERPAVAVVRRVNAWRNYHERKALRFTVRTEDKGSRIWRTK